MSESLGANYQPLSNLFTEVFQDEVVLPHCKEAFPWGTVDIPSPCEYIPFNLCILLTIGVL
jgi:hypothetical protein